MSDREKDEQEVLIDYINEIITKDNRTVIGVTTSQYENDDDISSVIVKIAPKVNDSHE